MIDVESEIYTPIARELKAQFAGITVSGEQAREPSRFPFVSIVEIYNVSDKKLMDTADSERYALITYRVDIYSNKTPGRKSECRSIFSVIDGMMYRMNFVRETTKPPEIDENGIYHIILLYRAETDGERLYRV